jgi:predicted Zn-dependent protease
VLARVAPNESRLQRSIFWPSSQSTGRYREKRPRLAGPLHFLLKGTTTMKNCHALAVLALLMTASLLPAKEFTHEASGLRFTLPKGWTCVEDGDRIIVTNEDKTLSCVGGVIPKDSAKAIFADIGKFLDTLDDLEDVEVTDGPEKETVNGLEQAWYSGTASVTGDQGETEEIEWDMTIVTGGKAILFLVGIGKIGDDEEAYEEFFESIQKATADSK